MDLETSVKDFSEVAQWLYQHREHLIDAQGETPADLLFEFLSAPWRLIEYHNYDPEKTGGCKYIFKYGPHVGNRCGQERCRFHDHVIFSSEFHTKMERFRNRINEKAKPKIKMFVRICPDEKHYIEMGKNLAIIRVDNKYICVGYFHDEDKIQALTPELIEYCDSLGIDYRPNVDSNKEEF